MCTLICGHRRVAKNYVQHLFHLNIIGFQFVSNWFTNMMLINTSHVNADALVLKLINLHRKDNKFAKL